MKYLLQTAVLILLWLTKPVFASEMHPTIVKFSSGKLTLRGELYKPMGKGPFPAVLYNHGSAPGMLNSQASAVMGPEFVKNGWVFFMPYRRGQGLSEDQGKYILDEIRAAKWSLFGNASKTMVKLLSTQQLDDQLAAYTWLKKQKFIQANRIATAGNSFGGIEVLLGMARADYCAGIDASGGAESWRNNVELQKLMKDSVKEIRRPVFFFQAENDYDLSPSKVLAKQMRDTGKISQLKIYPKFGASTKSGHSFPYRSVSTWFNDGLTFLDKYCKKRPGSTMNIKFR